MARKKKQQSENRVLLGAGLAVLAFISLVFFFGPQTAGQITQTYQHGIEAQYEIYRGLGETVAQECLRNAPRVSTTRCCAFADVPNSDASCITFCDEFGNDKTTCYQICQDTCKRAAAYALSISGTIGQ